MILYGDGMLEINAQMFLQNNNEMIGDGDVKLIGFELF